MGRDEIIGVRSTLAHAIIKEQQNCTIRDGEAAERRVLTANHLSLATLSERETVLDDVFDRGQP